MIHEFRFGTATVRIGNDFVAVDGKPLKLEPQQKTLLVHLAANCGYICMSSMLIEAIRLKEASHPTWNLLKVLVCTTTKTLTEANPEMGRLIETHWGRGYGIALRIPNPDEIRALELEHEINPAILPPHKIRWTPNRKAVVAYLVLRKRVPPAYVLARYPDMLASELSSWLRSYTSEGKIGLYTTRPV